MGMRRGRRRDHRGAVAVEAALMTPILVTFLVGIVEMALLMRDDVALTSAVRAGGRSASANAGAGPGGVNEGGDCVAPCSPTNAPMLAQLAANTIQRAGTALPKDSITELWIYRANAQGYPGNDGNTTWVCTTNCVTYRWVDARDQFRYYSGTWQSSTINACANSGTDAVGIYMKADHDFLTGFFVEDIDVEDHAVFSFEPLPNDVCAPGAHS
jgi:Flp pilus assembly protein TadG